MPALNGVEATEHIKAARPATTVVAWTLTNDPGVIGRFARAGAVAHLVKADLGGLTALLQRLGS